MNQTKNDILQGTLTLLILQTLETHGVSHGYGLCGLIQSASADLLRIEEGSLYPALHRMEQAGWLTATWKITQKGRRARSTRSPRAAAPSWRKRRPVGAGSRAAWHSC